VTQLASAVVLAGGASRRLGQDKRAIALDPSRTLLEQTVARVATVADDVVVVASTLPPHVDLGDARVVPDRISGLGPLGGLVAGLTAVRHARALIVACDLPFLDSVALKAMLDSPVECDLLVPRRRNGTLEMLHAVYRVECSVVAERLIASGRLKLAELADALTDDGRHVHYLDDDFFRPLDPELLTFFNVNTPPDLAEARRRLTGRQS
jgi:molybdopterin-guanine dinucleotide biosynthesis protein A